MLRKDHFICNFENKDTGMIMFNDLVQIVEKYWKNYENYEQELREACNAFGKFHNS